MAEEPVNPIRQARAVAEITRKQVETNSITLEQIAFRLSRIEEMLSPKWIAEYERELAAYAKDATGHIQP